MIQSFHDRATEDFFRTGRRPKAGWQKALTATARKLDYLNAAISLDDLCSPYGNHLEALDEDRKGQHSIRINRQWRICFVWTDAGPERVEITDYHD